MKYLSIFLSAGLSAYPLFASSPVAFSADAQSNYEKRTHIDVGEDSFAVKRTDRTEGCVGWGIVSDRIWVMPVDKAWSLDFEIYADRDWYRVETSSQWMNAIKFYRADGSVTEYQDLEIEFPAKRFTPFRFTGKVPPGAVCATVQFGINSRPTVSAGEKVVVRNVRFGTYEAGERIPEWVAPDIQPPLVRSLFRTPTANVDVKVRYLIEDATGVDWGRVAVTNESDLAQVPYVRNGNAITLKPAKPWPIGVTRLAVYAADTLGQTVVSHKVFLVGESAETPRITLRDDGVAMVGGKPWFPIGIYSVEPCAFNGFDYRKAFADLSSVGVDLGHSYRHWRDEAFYDGAKSAGARLFVNGKPAVKGDDWFMSVKSHDPIIAWYIGDDTSMNTTPQELLDRDEACRMLDGTRLTCHADGVGARRAKSNLRDYVDFADVFLPEIYPFDGHDDERCVAEVCRDMDRCFSDYARFGRVSRSRAVWPILQCFDGASWKRYPSAAEMYATSFAAIIHGAQGITWFKYGGAKSASNRYSGMFRTPEDWATMTNITRRISSLRHVLVERTPAQPPVPEIVKGPKCDPLGQPSVTMLMKVHDGEKYVFAVNASPEPVRARFAVGLHGISTANVMWENRSVSVLNGTFEDGFAAFAVHVYRIPADAVRSSSRKRVK